MNPKKTARTKNKSLLRKILVPGLMLFVLICSTFLFFYVTERISTKETRRQDNFAKSLRQYDIYASQALTDRDYEYLNRELVKLEKLTVGLESWLSVLKRRRSLVNHYPSSIENYRKSINSAMQEFPYSQPIAAIASEALIKDTAITRESEDTLRQWLPLFSDFSFNDLCLALHVLLGDLRNPQRGLSLPPALFSDGTEEITINLAILKILRGDYKEAASDVQSMLYSPSPSENSLTLAAEYHYDFGEILRSAEIFSLLNNDRARMRNADALYLAGFTDSARVIWSILTNLQNDTERKFTEQSLYNLALTAENHDEAIILFEKLYNMDLKDITDFSDAMQFGLIRYSRMLDYTQAVAALENKKNPLFSSFPYIELELLKRRSLYWALGRQIAETWMLLDRHDANEDLYKWAVWFFIFQRNFNEFNILLNRIEILKNREQLDSFQWILIYRAIDQMFNGNLETAEDILRSIPDAEAQWAVHANLGRIMEAYLSIPRALEQYELALEKLLSQGINNPKTAAGLQIRIARCFSIQNRTSDAMRALLFAVEYDPDNLTARLELDRLSY